MVIKKIKIKNFKSFKDLEIDLNDFNILIGANASGKSNFIHAFEFLRDIMKHGLENAISLQGDSEFLTNIIIGEKENLSIEFIADFEKPIRIPIIWVPNNKEFEILTYSEISYKFVLGFSRDKGEFKIVEDECKLTIDIPNLLNKMKKEKTQEKGILSLKRTNKGIEKQLSIPPGTGITESNITDHIESVALGRDFSSKRLMMETPLLDVLNEDDNSLRDISVYNIDPRQGKKAAPVTGKRELDEDGSNLAIVLKKLLANHDNREQFTNLLNDVLGFVEDLEVQKSTDRSLLVHLKEIYSKEKLLPASLLSDGTLNITALIIALYFEKKSFVVIEEPERNIHPHLISKIVSMMQEVSKKKQIFVTTHNPEILKHARLEDILFIYRDKDGFSQISRPAESEQVKIFLENEMGIDELYVQNLLGI